VHFFSLGLVSPFLLAVLLNAIAAYLIFTYWEENYGHSPLNNNRATILHSVVDSGEKESNFNDEASTVAFLASPMVSVMIMQTSFEAGMYIFVFLWSPVLESFSAHYKKDIRSINRDESEDILPFGIIFSTFMLFTMTGSLIFKLVRQKYSDTFSFHSFLFPLFVISFLTFIIPLLSPVLNLLTNVRNMRIYQFQHL
jgi:hypothetical protein